MAYIINNKNVQVFQYNEKNRMVTIACHLDEDGELQYGASIFQKVKGESWKRKDHIKTAMNRFVLNPVYLQMTKDLPTNVVRDFARRALYKNGVCLKDDRYEGKMEKNERLEYISLVVNSHGKVVDESVKVVDECKSVKVVDESVKVVDESVKVNRRNGLIFERDDFDMEKYNSPVTLKKRSKVKTFVKMFESKFISVKC
jgi:hypothetical protein